jgi:hypothetical protein
MNIQLTFDKDDKITHARFVPSDFVGANDLGDGILQGTELHDDDASAAQNLLEYAAEGVQVPRRDLEDAQRIAEFKQRYFECVGDLKTRGKYGVVVVGGKNMPDDPDGIYTFDSDVLGTFRIAAVGDPDFVEVTEEEYDAL